MCILPKTFSKEKNQKKNIREFITTPNYINGFCTRTIVSKKRRKSAKRLLSKKKWTQLFFFFTFEVPSFFVLFFV